MGGVDLTILLKYLAEDRGPTIIALNASITAVAVVVVCARVLSRYAILKRIGLDDWTIVLSTIFAIGNIVLASQSKLHRTLAY